MSVADFTLKVRRFKPEDQEGPYWETFDVDLDPTLSVLDGLLQAKDREDGSLAVRCSCRAAICGSCGMKVNGQSTLGCKTQIGEAQEQADKMAAATGVGADVASSPIRGVGGGIEGTESGPDIETATVPAGGSVPIVIEPMGNMPVIK